MAKQQPFDKTQAFDELGKIMHSVGDKPTYSAMTAMIGRCQDYLQKIHDDAYGSASMLVSMQVRKQII